MENDLIRADGIEATEFPELAQRFQVYAVPKTVINEAAIIEGALPEELFLDEILKTLNPPMAKADSSSPAQSSGR
jgi:predicted DsbA family dithiol-disulfide isomerase